MLNWRLDGFGLAFFITHEIAAFVAGGLPDPLDRMPFVRMQRRTHHHPKDQRHKNSKSANNTTIRTIDIGRTKRVM